MKKVKRAQQIKLRAAYLAKVGIKHLEAIYEKLCLGKHIGSITSILNKA